MLRVPILEARVWNQGVGEAVLPPKALTGEDLCFFQILGSSDVLWIVATSFRLRSYLHMAISSMSVSSRDICHWLSGPPG